MSHMSQSIGLARLGRIVLLGAALLGTAAGFIALLLVLAGVFHPKVGGEQSTPTATARPPDGTVAEVRLIRRARMETAVGTVRPVHEAAVASKLLPTSDSRATTRRTFKPAALHARRKR